MDEFNFKEFKEQYLNDLNPYETIFEALKKDGYTEEQAEELICAVIEEQKGFDEVAKRIHEIIESLKNGEDYWS